MSSHVPTANTNKNDGVIEPSWWQNTKECTGFIVKRLMQRNLTQVASSLTFTTILALVPLFAVVLALFTAFPLFTDFKDALQHFLTSSFLPDAVSESVMAYLNEFAAKASSLTAIGSLFLIITSIMLISTIDDTFNAIWLVSEKRPITQRILVYWAIISLGPIVAGASLWASSILTSQSLGYIKTLSVLINFTLSFVPFILTTLAFTALFACVPNHKVLWRDAFTGAVITTFTLAVLREGFAIYIIKFPTYTLIYGAFAAVPLFLMWLYVSWLVVLLGASLVAILPSLRRRNWTNQEAVGVEYITALAIIELLWSKRSQSPLGLATGDLSHTLKMDPGLLQTLLDKLKEIGYVVNTMEDQEMHWVLACDPETTTLAPLVDNLLVDRNQTSTKVACSMMDLINATIANPELTVKTLLTNSDTISLYSQKIQQQLLKEIKQGADYAKG